MDAELGVGGAKKAKLESDNDVTKLRSDNDLAKLESDDDDANSARIACVIAKAKEILESANDDERARKSENWRVVSEDCTECSCQAPVALGIPCQHLLRVCRQNPQ